MGVLWSRNYLSGVVPTQGQGAGFHSPTPVSHWLMALLWGSVNSRGTSCSLHTATPAQAAQGQTPEDCRKAGWLLEVKHTEAKGCACRNGNRAPRGIWSTHRVHPKHDLCPSRSASTMRTESSPSCLVSSAPAQCLHVWDSVNIRFTNK